MFYIKGLPWEQAFPCIFSPLQQKALSSPVYCQTEFPQLLQVKVIGHLLKLSPRSHVAVSRFNPKTTLTDHPVNKWLMVNYMAKQHRWRTWISTKQGDISWKGKIFKNTVTQEYYWREVKRKLFPELLGSGNMYVFLIIV